MKRQSFYPTRHAEQAVWLKNFEEKLPQLAAEIGLEPDKVTAAVADAGWLFYLLTSWLEAVRTLGKAATESLEMAQTGAGSKPITLPALIPPRLPENVLPRDPGALTRLFTLTASLRGNKNCTAAMKADLGLDGPSATGPDPDTLRPEISAKLTTNGVKIAWGWQGWAEYLDQCEIHVDRSDGQGWRLLTYDTIPGYVDSSPAPATLTRWKYRAIYRADDARIGDWSTEVSIPLGGN